MTDPYEPQVDAPGPLHTSLNDLTLMTGQEWYDRFVKELLLYFDEDGDYPKHLDGYKTVALFNVAREAAGIDTTPDVKQVDGCQELRPSTKRTAESTPQKILVTTSASESTETVKVRHDSI